MIKDAITSVIQGEDLSEADMIAVMNEVMSGEATPAQIGSFLTALRIKGETSQEITGAARVMREKSTKINAGGGMSETGNNHVVDTCGTGGDDSMTFNISTAAAFVVSAAGITVAKHGNRSVSSKSGSADVLKSLGVNIEANVPRVEECLREVGIGFLFAPLLHGAMKYAAPVRRELGIRTIFNVLGPLTNPAGATRQVIGVYAPQLTDILAKVLFNLGCEHAFVVRGEDGLDEITTTTETKVSELKDGSIKSYHLKPEDLGVERSNPDDLKGGDPDENAGIILSIFKGEKGPRRDIVVVNAAAALVAGGVSKSLSEATAVASWAIESGEALKKVDKLKELTNR